MSVEDKCSHGRSYDVACDDCEIVWHEQMIVDAKAMIARHERKLSQIRERQTAASQAIAIAALDEAMEILPKTRASDYATPLREIVYGKEK